MAGYGDDAGFTAWLADNGYSLPNGTPDIAILRQRGSAYIDAVYGARFPGAPTGGLAQERAWPRTGAMAYNAEIPPDVIPNALIVASYAAAWYEANNPGALSIAASAASTVKREKIGPIETEYFAGTGDAIADATIRLAEVEGLLAPFLLPEAETAILFRAVG